MKTIKYILSSILICSYLLLLPLSASAWVGDAYPFTLVSSTMQPLKNYSPFSVFKNQSTPANLTSVTFTENSIRFQNELIVSSTSTAAYSYQRIESFSNLGTLDDETGFTVILELKLNQSPLNTLTDSKVGQTGFVLNVRSASLNREMYFSIIVYNSRLLITSYTGNRASINQSTCEKLWYDNFNPNKTYTYRFSYDRIATNKILTYIKPEGSNVFEYLGHFSEPTYRTTSMSYFNQDFVMASSVNRSINARESGGSYIANCNNIISNIEIAKGVPFNATEISSYSLTENRNKMVGGIGTKVNPRIYWIDTSSINSEIEGKIVSSWEDWMDGTPWGLFSPVSVERSMDYTNSCYDFHMENLQETFPGVIGVAIMYDGIDAINENGDEPDTDWTWCRVFLDSDRLVNQIPGEVAQGVDYVKATIAHEIGHGLGLMHTGAGTGNLMVSTNMSVMYDRATLGEYRGLYDLYDVI